MLHRLYTLFILSLLACHLAASPLATAIPAVHQARTLHNFWPPIYFWPFRNGWPIFFPKPNPPKPTPTPTKPNPTPTTKPAPTYGPSVPTYGPSVPPTPTNAPSTAPTVAPTNPPSTPPNTPTNAPTSIPVPSSSAPPSNPPASSSPSSTPPPSQTVVPTSSSVPSPTNAPGSVIPVGQVIEACTVPGTVALTFDDGPFQFTNQLLDIFARNNAKLTLFVNGQNFGSITDFSPVIQRAVNEGHQVGSHTFGHARLSDLNRDQITTEMTRLDDVVAQILSGNRPTYMRAPFFAYSDVMLQTMKDLKYHVIDANVDTKDFEHNTPEGVPESMRLFKAELDAGGSISLSHDVHQTTVQLLAQQMLDEVKARGLRPVTVGECLGDPKENWYRKA
ncbi:hypothetical protein LOZ57_003141 [Ophidiomyces ophidiicola]|uniref:uncharacterized protein n=1 Tax=Ophidiomyces ophidiicola TaxID=1387563 RepID=UPI0020C55AAF